MGPEMTTARSTSGRIRGLLNRVVPGRRAVGPVTVALGDYPDEYPGLDGTQYPGREDTGHANRRRDISLRLMAFIVGVQGVIILGQFAAIMQLLPQQRWVPMLLTAQTPDHFVVKVEPLEDQKTALLIAEKGWIAEWITYRHEIVGDQGEMVRRIGWLMPRTEENLLIQTKAATHKVIDDALNRRMTRTLDRNSLEIVNLSPGYWEINFKLLLSEEGSPIGELVLRSHMRTGLRRTVNLTPDQARQADPSLAFGFTVLGYDPVVISRTGRAGE